MRQSASIADLLKVKELLVADPRSRPRNTLVIAADCGTLTLVLTQAQLTKIWQRGLPLIILAMACIGAPALMLSQEGLPRLRTLKAEMQQVERENAELSEQIRQLQQKVQHLKQDPHAVERIARDELGLVRNTEVVYQFPAQP